MSISPNTLKDARILFLPGGRWQVPAIQTLRHAGAFVVCCDNTPNAPGFEAADEFVRLPLQDVSQLVQIGRTANVNCVMTDQTDFAVPIVAQVATELGCRALPTAVAHSVTNKAAMRQALKSATILQPRFRVCRTIQDLNETVRDFGLPLFIKPVDAQSSRGVAKITDSIPQQLEKQLHQAIAQSSNGSAIVEEYISGTECTVEGFVATDGPQVLAISHKSHYPELAGVARTLTYPAAIPEVTRLAIHAAHTQIVETLGIPFGITHTEFIVDKYDRPWLIETAARGGGSLISSHIVPAVSGFEPILGLAQQLLGHRVQIHRTLDRAAELRFIRLETGQQITGFPNLSELRQHPGVLWIHIDAEPGQTLSCVTDDRTRHGFVIAIGDDRETATNIAAQIEADLIVEYAESRRTIASPHFATQSTRHRVHESRE